MTNEDVYQMAICRWGRESQLVMMVEECTELGKEACKLYRGNTNIDGLSEEIADVEIMIAQMKIMYDCQEQVSHMKNVKIERLKDTLGIPR